ncbi:MAG: GNAT family N-acetyltransferase [Bacillota bacterium]
MEKVDFKIEKAVIDDAEEILKLQKLAYLSEAEIYNDYGIPPLRQTIEEITGEFAVNVFLKAVSDGKIIGSVRGFEKDGTCFIGRLFVHPDYRNKGIGACLMKSIEEAFGHCSRFELFTGHKSEKNLYLYRKIGYTDFKRENVSENLQFVYLEKARG